MVHRKAGHARAKKMTPAANGECHQGIKGRVEEANGGGEEEETAVICAKYV